MFYRCSAGKFVITFEDMEKLLGDAGEVCFFKEIKEKMIDDSYFVPNRCRTCVHYGFYRIITNGPYGYSGPIPCTTCVHFSWSADNYTPSSGIGTVSGGPTVRVDENGRPL